MPDKTDYARKCQQLDVLIDLLEKERARLKAEYGEITKCKDCTFFDNANECEIHGGEFDPDAFCSYGIRRATA